MSSVLTADQNSSIPFFDIRLLDRAADFVGLVEPAAEVDGFAAGAAEGEGGGVFGDWHLAGGAGHGFGGVVEVAVVHAVG